MGRSWEEGGRRRRKKGCITGCLTNFLLVLGVLALLFVGAHVLGFVENDPETGAPSLSVDNVKLPQIDWDKLPFPEIGK